ncbi:MAG: hypothetical protein K0R67_2089 [Paenibacillus sp.]|jgi:hypothetical protein|nr:hypothetical protein [Paenibacillus sp.]
MHQAHGNKIWFIPDGYIPPTSSGSLESHESICVLNTSSEEAILTVTIFFEDREPLEDIQVIVPARRTRHIRTNGLQHEGEFIPVGVPYAAQVVSTVSVIIQYSRLDATQAENALMSVMAYPLK